MTYAIDSGLFTLDELKIINYCRLYLHVTTLSELLNADGKTINNHLFLCNREPWFDNDTYVTLQRRPTNFHIKTTWQRLCRQWFDSTGTLAQSIKLGPWSSPGAKLRRRRETYWQHTSPPTIHHWRYGRYWLYRQSDHDPDQFVPSVPITWNPEVTRTPIMPVQHPSGLLTLASRRPKLPLPTTPRTSATFHEYVSHLPQWQQHLLAGIQFHKGPFAIADRIHAASQSNQLILVSDGSQMDNHITFGWVLGNPTGIKYAENSQYGFGTPTSHRAEAWGNYFCTIFGSLLIQGMQPTQPFQ